MSETGDDTDDSRTGAGIPEETDDDERSALREIVQSIYDAVLRERLPRKIAVCNGIPARRVRLLDSTDVMPDYEAELLTAIREHVSEGDRVIDIGGGFGVAAVAAANQVGSGGQVISYEASTEHVDLIRETASMNRVDDRIEVRDGIVGTGIDVWGDTEDTPVVDPADLPSCDVLVMDCEGAEETILSDLGVEPRIVIVEVHPHLGPSVEGIEARFDELGYSVLSREREVGETEIYIVTASRTRDD